ncbi:unannotated protein [freshwater metagenome]|uniref:Unannotated protein n=1 Tax=freshwater metagenome TaxID=449393 RepID=A0A6J7EMY3_9ZZZZ|nr:hypothetical protein [Actinomycetota bacterium]
MSSDPGRLYAAARERITAIAQDLPAGAAERVCPATPEWTVHEVLAHLRGVTEDVRLGNLVGVATDPWTAKQVERLGATPIAELLSGWAEDAPLIEAVLSMPNPGEALLAVFDAHAHEADLRGALGLAPFLADEFAEWCAPKFARGFIAKAAAADLPGVQVVTDEGDRIGATDAPTVLRLSRFEFFRAVLGRRSAAQVLAYNWGSADAAAYLTHLFVFGPRADDLVE